MKILHVYKTYYPDTHGGVEHFIKTLTRHTSKLGCENQLLTLSKNYLALNEASIDVSLNVIRLPLDINIQSCPFSYQFLIKFKKYAAQADLIHYHFPWPCADLVQLLRQPTKPAIVTYHSDIVKQRFLKLLYDPIGYLFLQQMRCIVATSANYSATSKNLQRWRAKTKVIPVGIDQEDYIPISTATVDKWSAEYGNDFFLFVGVLRYYKGLHILLEAMQTLKRPLLIAGTGPCERALKAQAERLQLTQVYFLGFISDQDKSALLHLCRAVIFPSHFRSEAFGITLVEGLLFGKPLISCEIGTGTSFVNQHEQTGFVIPPADPLSLQRALQKLTVDDALVATMSRAARLRYDELFTAEKMARAYVELYQNCLT